MSFELIPTPPFERELKRLAKKYPSVKNDVATLAKQLVANPTMGISLGNNCYKIRITIASKGTGKSGGARVITLVRVMNEKIFLLSIYDKSTQSDISEKEIQQRLRGM